MSDFRWAHPWAFGIAAIVLMWWGYRWWRGRRGELPALAYPDAGRLVDLPRGWRVRLRGIPDILRGLAWVFLVVALARPQGGDVREVLRGRGIDLVFVLDISGSMAAVDFEPKNRLEAAKQVISEFLDGRTFDRVGVVLFAREAFVLVPLTLDYRALRGLLARARLVTEVEDDSGQRPYFDGTNPGSGLAAAEAMMRDSDARSKVAVLLTDGAHNAGLDPVLSAQAVAALGVRVYTIGMGRPESMGGDPLDEPTLQAMADAGNGLYFRAEDTDGLRRVVSQIDRLERSPVERQLVIPWQDWAWGWLTAGLILLFIERVLRMTVWGERL